VGGRQRRLLAHFWRLALLFGLERCAQHFSANQRRAALGHDFERESAVAIERGPRVERRRHPAAPGRGAEMSQCPILDERLVVRGREARENFGARQWRIEPIVRARGSHESQHVRGDDRNRNLSRIYHLSRRYPRKIGPTLLANWPNRAAPATGNTS